MPHRPTIWVGQTAAHQPTTKILSTNQKLAVAGPDDKNDDILYISRKGEAGCRAIYERS